MERIYQPNISDHLSKYRQMVFLSGPRQSGKTTLNKTCVEQTCSFRYLNWDDVNDRRIILNSIDEIIGTFQLNALTKQDCLPVVIFDEIHKYKNWKSMLKGYFDKAENQLKMIVTGSDKLNY